MSLIRPEQQTGLCADTPALAARPPWHATLGDWR